MPFKKIKGGGAHGTKAITATAEPIIAADIANSSDTS
jgi:hypothetical protein